MYLNRAVLQLTVSGRAEEFCQDLEVKEPEPTISLVKSLSGLWYEIRSKVSILRESVLQDKYVCVWVILLLLWKDGEAG